jgi:hypothetical protein
MRAFKVKKMACRFKVPLRNGMSIFYLLERKMLLDLRKPPTKELLCS